MTLEELLLKLKNLEYTSNVLGEQSNFHVINQKHFNHVENLIRQYALEHHDEELGVLKAKVYAYEQIIANSNFAPMIIKKENTVDIGELARQVVGKKTNWEDIKNGKGGE